MVSTAQTRHWIGTIDWSFASRIEFWLEVMWLSALALVPILFAYSNSLATFEEPKSYALHFFALLTLVLLIVDGANNIWLARKKGEKFESFDVSAWLRQNKANLLLASVITFSFIYVISTALSELPFYSFWGVTPATGGYSLYTFLSMMVIFFSIVTYVRDISQLRRILYLIATIGTLTGVYGVTQHFGWDPIGIVDNSFRVVSTFGNPIYFGAYLVMSIPVTLMLVADPANRTRYWLLAVIAIGVGIQVAAMWFTVSRGPLTGLVAALIVTLVVALLLLNRRQIAYIAAILAAGIVVMAGILFPPVESPPTRTVQFSNELSGSTTQDGAGIIQGGLRGRSEIWSDVLELSVTWETFQEDEGLARILRPVFGFGPDMLRYSSSLVAKPRASLEIVDNAHNRALQVLAEQGWAGFLAFLTVVGMIVWLLALSGKKLFSSKSSVNGMLLVSFVAVLGGLAGTGVEQIAGVGRVSDLFTSWVLIGLVVVLYRHVSGARLLRLTGSSVASDDGRRSSPEPALPNSSQPITAVPFFIGVIALVAALTTFVLVDVQILRASRISFGQTEAVDTTEVFNRFVHARDTAPQIEHFTVFAVEILIDDSRSLLELGEEEEALKLADKAFKMLLEYHERNPLAIRTRILLAETAALIVEIGDLEFRDEMVLRYEELVRQFPNEAVVTAVMANAYAAADMFDESLTTANRAIELEAATRPIPQAWWVRGKALERLGREDEAIASYETAIEKGPTTEFALLSHEDLAAIYIKRDDTENANIHLDAAEELEKSAN